MTDARAAAEPPDAKPVPAWRKWWKIIAAIGGLAVVAYKAFAPESLAKCDSTAARDALSDAFNKEKLHPTSYSEIKTLSSSKDLVECRAVLPAGEAGTLNVDYRFFWKDAKQQLKYSISATK